MKWIWKKMCSDSFFLILNIVDALLLKNISFKNSTGLFEIQLIVLLKINLSNTWLILVCMKIDPYRWSKTKSRVISSNIYGWINQRSSRILQDSSFKVNIHFENLSLFYWNFFWVSDHHGGNHQDFE